MTESNALRPIYLDTSALMRRAEAAVTTPTQRNQAIAPVVDAIIRDPGNDVRLSTLTVTEFRDALALDVRANRPHEVDFTADWMSRSVLEAMQLIDAGHVSEVEVPVDAGVRATVLVDMATRDHGVAFRVWDATHLITACNWGYTLQTPVELLTTDDDYQRFVGLFPHFNNYVTIKNVDPGGLKSTY